MEGYNGTIFAYGQTGSGKTYTIVGEFNNKLNINKLKGIVPRTFNYIFNKINSLLSITNQYNIDNILDINNNINTNTEKKQNLYKYNISLAFVQLYLESIQDLLDIESNDIRIREDPDKGVYLEGVQWYKCNSPEECEEVFHKGELNRNTESTRMNLHSSRSHAILIIKVEKSMKIINPKNIKNIKNTERLLTCSYLHLVDLAGSERVRKTGATDMRLEEAKKINLSLLCLGNVISSLTNPTSSHISYRDSKLTRLLKESLGGNAKTSLIVTVSPSTYNQDETMSSLLFALRAMKVQNRPIINKTIDYQALCIKLQDDLDKLNDDYAKLKLEYDKVNTELDKYKKGEEYLELQKKMGLENISINLDSQRDNNKSSSGDLANYNSNSTGSNANTIESSSQKNNSINNINQNNLGKKNNNENSNKEIEKYKDQIKKIKKFYEKLMKNKKNEYENILKKVDDIIYKKENEIDQLNLQITELNLKVKKQKEDLDDMSKEKESLQNSVSTLSTQVEEQKNLLKNDKTEKQYKALIEILNDNIAALEKKIIQLEDTSTFTETSKEKIINSLSFEQNEFQAQINNLIQQKNNSLIKQSQNEVKIKLISSEKNIDFNSNEKINEQIIQIQKENFELLIDQESITKKVEIIENKIKTTKKLNKNLNNILDKYDKKNKAELIMTLAKKEIDNIILNDSIKTYDNILQNTIQLQHDNKFNLYKVENDLNTLINKSSLLLNNYLNYINKIDDINKELELIVNDPENFDKLNQMRESLQVLLEESQDINNIIKDKSIYNNNTSINNITYDKCPSYLENIITNMSENFLILIETYNSTNSNICHLITLMEESTCYKKKFITNLASFVQESVKDDFSRQNILYKLTELLKSKMKEKEYNNKIEEIIKELFDKIVQNLNEKEKENKILNQSVNLYMKQIDENIKKNNLNINKQFISRNSYNEISNLKLKLINQQKTITNTKTNIDKMSTSFNKVNELIKSTNLTNNIIDTNKITNALAECQNFVQNMSKGLNVEINKNNNNSNDINNILKKSLQKDSIFEIKNINDKKLPHKIFKQYFNHLSKFSKSIVDYGINDDI